MTVNSGMGTYAAVILCGGKSTRMGQDKATMLLDNVRLVDRLIREFAPCGEILLSAGSIQQAERIAGIPADSGKKPASCDFVVDEIPDAGPLAGIAAALKKSRAEWLFVTAVDMPFMDCAFADELWMHAEIRSGSCKTENYDVIVPLDTEGRPQMLSAFYRKTSLQQIETCLKKGNRRVRSCLDGLRVCRVRQDDLSCAEKKLLNVNDPHEWERIAKGSF